MQLPRRLHGMEDKEPQTLQDLTWAAGVLGDFLASYGYRRIDTPLLEETELLMRKSGGELASRMYTFTDPGGHRVSLRPEFTSSVMRAYLQGMNDMPLPVRYCYEGPVFRYSVDGEDPRQFTQVGAELIGASGPWADAEVLGVAAQGLSRLGVKGCHLVVGHLGFIAALLEAQGVSDRARLFLLSNVGALSRGEGGVQEVRERALALGLAPEQGGNGVGGRTEAPSEEAVALLEQYLRNATVAVIGTRTSQEIRERFLSKQRTTEDAVRFDAALNMLARVAQVKGDPDAALASVRRLGVPPQARAELDGLAGGLEALSQYGAGARVSLDFGLARGIAYYSGVVFDIRHGGLAGPSLGGGGRYDGLAQSLGGAGPVPAMGFAWSLERVVDAAKAGRSVGGPPSRSQEAVLVRPAIAAAMTAALREAARLRKDGEAVLLEMHGRSLNECLRYARVHGAGQVITVDKAGKATRKNVSKR